ncbi:restriction endonuclease subunit S [Aliarcobacter skirrowii]|uniref:restriction endonuclease subunit S n=1 Tax=Aliarcobacter skirrowii TaxID=28200 RepID=UPI0029A85D32|nr:restriction endonuclease subunit S [Aliarcobacter skirrowii]MDX4026566.1 restriction endonuclease subunit S [Aliarcobacter skirrowii]
MSELYSLPDGWEWKSLNDVVFFQEGPGILKSQMSKDGIPLLNIRTFNKDETLNLTDTNFIPKETIDKKYKHFLVEVDDILVASSGSLGKMAIVRDVDLPALLNTSIIRFRPLDINKMDRMFLKYFLNSDNFSNQYNNAYTGSAIKNFGPTHLKQMNIILPPFEEQKRIVAKLDNLFAKIDKAIALHQKNIDEADIFMASVLNDVFVELEEKYEKQKLSEIVIFGGKNISTLEYPNLIYFSLEDIEAQTGKILNFKTVNESGVKGTAVRFDDNVVLYSKLRPYLNKVIVPNLEGCATTELVVIKPKDKVDKYFLASYLRSSNIVNFLNNDSMGAKMPRTNMKTFRNLDISFPPLPTQQKVVSYLDEISNKIEKIKQIQKEKMQSLKELKASILDKAFKGEL